MTVMTVMKNGMVRFSRETWMTEAIGETKDN